MSERLATKKVVQFAKREYREKHPLSVIVARTKPELIFSKGFLSSLTIQRHKISQLIIIAEYHENYRIYSFSKSADLLGAENLKKSPQLKHTLEKSVSTVYQLPKQPNKEMNSEKKRHRKLY